MSVIIPTYNEEAILHSLLSSLRALRPDEVIVADGNSSDRTAAIATPLAKVVLSERGRGTQLNAGARASSGSILLFLHADTRLAPGSLQAIRECMQDAEIAGGNFDVRFEGTDWTATVFTHVNRWRRKMGVFYGDSGIFCRRDVFERLGGYRPWPLLEDYEFARRLRRAGKLAMLNEPIFVSDRRWRNSSLFAALWTWFWIQGLYLAGVHPEQLAKWYRDIRPVDSPNSPLAQIADTGLENVPLATDKAVENRSTEC